MQATEQPLSGWGNYPIERCYVTRPVTAAALEKIVITGEHLTYIPRGLGRAYGDAALNCDGGVILQTHFNRFLSFDERRGILECEAGVSFAEIIQHLQPRGWFLPVTPGTKYVTVGGAIAADVHGKNHHRDGSFGNFVLDFKLLTAAGETLPCSRGQNADIFRASLGGMGLTGVIVSARIQLRRITSAYYNVTYRRTAHLDETLESLAATNHAYQYSVAWVDCLASGASLGRSILMLGNGADATDLPEPLRHQPLATPVKRTRSVPAYFPSRCLNSWSVKLFNALYYAHHRDSHRFVDYDTFFYPLDHVLSWNRIYGRGGFVQYQALFPPASARHGLVELLERVAYSRKASFLAVLKSSGPASPSPLSYLYPGYTLALDLPNTGEDLRRLLGELDMILLKHGGRLYLAKDAMTTPEAFAAMYPQLHDFRAVKAAVDPNQRFGSSQARRVGIVEQA